MSVSGESDSSSSCHANFSHYCSQTFVALQSTDVIVAPSQNEFSISLHSYILPQSCVFDHFMFWLTRGVLEKGQCI